MSTTTRQRRRDTAPPRRPRGRPTGLLVVLLVMAVGLIVALIVYLNRDDDPHPGRSTTPPAAELPSGLRVGGATATYDLSTTTIGEMPWGFPRTVEGAVEASAAIMEFSRTAGAELPIADRTALLEQFDLLKYQDTQDLVARFQAREGLDADGQPVNGRPGDRYYNDCLPEYGMYSVTGPGGADVESSAPSDVYVFVWAPCIEGVGSPQHIDDLRVKWDVYPAHWLWSSEGWRQAPGKVEWPGEVPTPSNKLFPNVSVDERAQLFGSELDKWQLFTGYSAEWPAGLLGVEPTK